MLRIRLIYENEKGAVLVVALAFIVVLGLLGTTAVLITTTDMKIGGNYKVSQQAFYEADAGVEEARARMKGDADSSIEINDVGYTTDIDWKEYIETNTDDAVAIGYVAGPKETVHASIPAVDGDTDFDYVVKIEHSTDGASNILYWGDTNDDGIPERTTTNSGQTRTIYLVTSYGFEGGSNDTVQIEITRLPPITVPGALYVEATTKILGNSTSIIGMDACGGSDVPGIVTPMSTGITETGGPTISGVNSPTPPPSDIAYGSVDMDIEGLFGLYAASADFYYNVTSETHTDSTTPGPGDGWGSPVQADSTPPLDLTLPSTCSESNIVYYDTNGTDVKLSGGVQGCGVLLVDGDLDLNGNFFWHGVVVVTGSITFTGGGNKNITGGLLAGSDVDADVVGGNANIVYCSTAINNLLQNKAFRRLSWKEEM